MMTQNKEGWTWLFNSRKDHYFVDGRSLCGRWLCFSDDVEIGDDDNKDNCKACQRELKKRKKLQQAATA